MTKEKKAKKTASSREQKFFNKWRSLFLFLVSHVFYMIRFKLVYRLEVYGRENIPKTNAYIVAPNHLSTLDPPLIAGIMPRSVAFMWEPVCFHNLFKTEFKEHIYIVR